jgi:hypothetical protein
MVVYYVYVRFVYNVFLSKGTIFWQYVDQNYEEETVGCGWYLGRLEIFLRSFM